MKIQIIMFGPTAWGETPDQTADNLARHGINELVWFTSLYYGYRILQPRYPGRAIYTLETDRVFYDSDPSYYQGGVLRPQKSRDFAEGDSLALMAAACRRRGINFVPLIPICAAGRFAQEYPDLAVHNLYGCADRLFLCYNNPEVRRYRQAMVREIAERYDVDDLCLDKIPQTMLEQCAQSGFFDPPLRTVGSFCFCSHCHAAAARRGLDLEAVRRRSREIADRSLRIPPHVVYSQLAKLAGDTEIPLLLLEEPLIYQTLQFRFDTAVEFVGELRAVIREANPRGRVQAAFVPSAHFGHDATSPRSWLTIQSYKKYAGVLDELMSVVHQGPDIVRFETERAVQAAEGKIEVFTSMRLYGQTRPAMVAELADAAIAGGSKGVSFLGYDVTTDALLEALGGWARARR